MPTGSPARAQTRAKAAAKPIKEEPVAEETAPAEETEPTTPPPGDLAQLVQDLQAAQDSDHDAIVKLDEGVERLSDELGSTNRALKNVIDQLKELAEFRQTAPAGVERELGLSG